MRLKELRKENKKTQEDLATLLNIAQVSYGRYELETSEPTIDTLCKLADYYDVTLDYLVGRTYKDELGYLEKSDKETIKLFLNLSESDKDKVTGYIQALIQK